MEMAEKLIMHRFFGRKLGLPELVDWMHRQYHKLVYAEDVLILNEANRDFDDVGEKENKASSLFCVALPPGTPEVKRMETSREAIFNSVRYGFASAFNALVIDPALEVSVCLLVCLFVCLFICIITICLIVFYYSLSNFLLQYTYLLIHVYVYMHVRVKDGK